MQIIEKSARLAISYALQKRHDLLTCSDLYLSIFVLSVLIKLLGFLSTGGPHNP